MTRKKLGLVLALILGAGVIAGGIAYAQETLAPDVIVAAQDPGTPQIDRSFSFFIDGGAFLGVHAEDITKENMSRYGLRGVRGVGVTQVVKDSPAEKAGLKKDDVILRFDGESVTSARKLNRLVSEVSADHSVKLTISRGGNEQEVSATLSKRNMENVFGGIGPAVMGKIDDDVIRRIPRGNWPFEINPGDGNFSFVLGANRRIGVSTQPLTKQLADYFGVKDGGLLITSVNENSPAAKAGLKAGDVITAVDGEKVTSPGDISRILNKKQDGEVSLTLIRDKNTRTINLTPEKSETQLVRPGRASTNVIRDRMRDSIRRGAADGRIVIPRIEIPAIPAINIQVPRIVVPATPGINVIVPRLHRGPKARVIII